MGTGSFPGVKYGRGVLLTTHPLLVPWSWKSRAIPLPTLWATTGSVTGTLYLYLYPRLAFWVPQTALEYAYDFRFELRREIFAPEGCYAIQTGIYRRFGTNYRPRLQGSLLDPVGWVGFSEMPLTINSRSKTSHDM